MKLQACVLLALALAAVMASDALDRDASRSSGDREEKDRSDLITSDDSGADDVKDEWPSREDKEWSDLITSDDPDANDVNERFMEDAYDKLVEECDESLATLHDRSAFGLVRFKTIAGQAETRQMSGKIGGFFEQHSEAAVFGHHCDAELPPQLTMFKSSVWPNSCSGVVHEKNIKIEEMPRSRHRQPFFDRVLIISDHVANPIKSVMELEFLFKASGYEYRAYQDGSIEGERRPNQKRFSWPERCARNTEGSNTQRTMNRSFSVIVDVEPVEILKNIYMLNAIVEADHIIVVQSTDFDLANVVAGVTNKPVVTYATSEGSWVSEGGRAGLNAMLDYCNAGVAVVNIDSSIGAWSWAVAAANFRRNAVLTSQLCVQSGDTCQCGARVSPVLDRRGGALMEREHKAFTKLERKITHYRKQAAAALNKKIAQWEEEKRASATEEGKDEINQRIAAAEGLLESGEKPAVQAKRDNILRLEGKISQLRREASAAFEEGDGNVDDDLIAELEDELNQIKERLNTAKTCTDRAAMENFRKDTAKFAAGICRVQTAMDREFMARYMGRDPVVNLKAHTDTYARRIATLLKNRLLQASGFTPDGIPRPGVSFMTSAFGKTNVQLANAMRENDYSPNIGAEQASEVLSCYYSKCFDNNGKREVMTCSNDQVQKEKAEAKRARDYRKNERMIRDMLDTCPEHFMGGEIADESRISTFVANALGPPPAPYEDQCPTMIHTPIMYDPVAKLLYRRDVTNDVDLGKNSGYFSGRACVVSAGIADQGVVRAMIKIFNLNGVSVDIEEDLGVNSIAKDTLRVMRLQSECDLFIATAGMEGTLPEVVAQIARGAPVISVPSNVGYGAHQEGMATLGAMSTYPTPGMVVTNIDAATSAVTVALSLMNTHYFKRDRYFETEREKNMDERSCDLCTLMKPENFAGNGNEFEEACFSVHGCAVCPGDNFKGKPKCVSIERVQTDRYQNCMYGQPDNIFAQSAGSGATTTLKNLLGKNQ